MLIQSTAAMTMQATDDEFVVVERGRQVEQSIQFSVIVVGRALESGTDQYLFGFVERPENALKLQYRLLTFGDHLYSVPLPRGEYKHPH